MLVITSTADELVDNVMLEILVPCKMSLNNVTVEELSQNTEMSLSAPLG